MADKSDQSGLGMNAIDRFVAFLSPTAGRNRVRARYEIAAIQEARKYEAAESNRFRKKRTESRSPDLANDRAAVKVRALARSLEQNHDIANSILMTLIAGVVGEGIRTAPTVKTKDGKLAKKVNKRIRRLWKDFEKRPEVTWEHSWQEVQRLALNSCLRDGEVFGQELEGNVPGHQHGTLVPYSLEMLEADYCPFGLTDMNSNIVQGVQKNDWGRPVAYRFYKTDPRESAFFFGESGNKTDLFTSIESTQGVDADRVIHLKTVKRFKQTRGMSIFAPIFTRLDDLKEFEESERIAARIGAAFAFAITRNDGYQGDTSYQSGKFRNIDLAPGIVLDDLAPGEAVESLKNERPNNQLESFRNSQLKAATGGVGANYSSVSKNFTNSYSAQRQEMSESAVIYGVIRRWFIDRFVDRVYLGFLRMALVSGALDDVLSQEDIDTATIYDVEHRGQGMPYINPKQEADADIALIKAGLLSRTQTILRRGNDPEEVRNNLIDEREDDYKENLFLTSDGAPEGVKTGGDDTAAVDPALETDTDTGDDKEDIAKTAFNGAQITAIQGIVQAVADGLLPGDTAKELLMASFPGLSQDKVDAMIDPAVDMPDTPPEGGDVEP